jgi:hypothetical protein
VGCVFRREQIEEDFRGGRRFDCVVQFHGRDRWQLGRRRHNYRGLNQVGGLFRIPAGGGAPAPITEPREGGEVTYRWPQILPGGKEVLFTAHTRFLFDDAGIVVMSLGDRHKKTLMRGGTYGGYLPSGHLLYVNRGTLFAVPFDLGALEVRGAPTPVLDQVAYNGITGGAGFEASQTGTLVYESGGVCVDQSPCNGWRAIARPKPLYQNRATTAVRASRQTDGGWRWRSGRRRVRTSGSMTGHGTL